MLQHIVSRLALSRIHPDYRKDFVRMLAVCFCRLFIQMATRRAENCLLNLIGIHLLRQPVHIKINVKRIAKLPYVGVRINFLEFTELIHYSHSFSLYC